MNSQPRLQSKQVQNSSHYNYRNGDMNENISITEMIADSAENKFQSNNNNRIICQTKDESNIESSYNLMQKPNSFQQDIKAPSHQYMNMQPNQFQPGQANQQNFYYKSMLSDSEEYQYQQKKKSEEINSLDSYQQLVEKQMQLTRSQQLIKSLSLKPVQYELYKSLREMKIKSEIAFFILVSENCMSLEEALSFITTDEENMHIHYFLPRNHINDDICEICLNRKRQHHKNTANMINFALQIRKQIKDLQQKDCLENADMKEMLLVSQDSQGPNRDYSNQQSNSPHFYVSKNSLVRKRMVTCKICYEESDESNMLQFNNQNHEICVECFRTYLSEEIMISNVENLRCPHCQWPLNEQIIIDHTTAALYKKYKHFLRNTLINKDPLKRFCPTPNCHQIIELTGKDQKIALCKTCQVIICTQCNRTEHKGISCEDLLEKEIEELTDSRDIQRCNKCKSLVQKVQGCNHMTCTVCEYQWCWLCGNTYTQIHMMPFNPFGCPFLQAERFTVKNMQMWKIYILRFLIFILVLILLPFAILFSGPVFALYGYFELTYRLRGIRMSQESLIAKIWIMIGAFVVFLLGFLLDPLILVSLIPFGIYILCIQYKEKSRIEAISNQRLTELQQRNQTVNNIHFNNQDQVFIQMRQE